MFRSGGGGARNVAFTPLEAFNVLIGKSICWGLGVRVARAGVENFVDDRGTALKVRRPPARAERARTARRSAPPPEVFP